MARGFFIILAISSSEPAPAAPTFFSASTAAGAVSYTTQ